MTHATRLPILDLRTADLIADAVCEGGSRGNTGDNPLDPLLNCGN
jgi:hypothetical protein